jgi:transportin-1
MTEEDSYTRAIAGLTLKNNLLNNFNRTPLTVLDHVKSVSLKALDSPDPDSTVRRTIGSVITAIIVRGQVLNWPESLTGLVHKLDSTDPLAVEVMNIQICERRSYLLIKLPLLDGS